MATKSDFSAEEWTALRTTPHLVAAAMMLAGNSGLFGSFKESFTAAQGMYQGLASSNALIQALSQKEEVSEAQSFVRSQISFADAPQAPGRFRDLAVAGVTNSLSALKRKQAMQDMQTYKQWLLDVAQKIAESAKEGGFLGFGGQLVSEGEQAFMQALNGATNSVA